MVLIVGASNSQVDKSITTIGGICVQDLWARKKTWQPDYIHNVFTHYQLFHINATLLFPVRIH